MASAVRVRDVTERRRRDDLLLDAVRMQAPGCLCGGVSHDFNNALTAIMGYSDLMKNRLQDEDPLRRFATEIREAASRAGAINRQLRAFSKRTRTEPRRLDPNRVLRDLAGMVHRLLGEDVELIVQQDDRLWKVKADVALVEQVILNLAIHVRSTLRNGGKFTLSTENCRLESGRRRGGTARLQPGDYVVTAIRIGSDEIAGDDASGLRLVQEIVRDTGGCLDFGAVPGEGAFYRIYLPREREEAGAGSGPAAVAEGHTHPQGETVLVVEDEEVVRELVERALSRQGYRVLSVANGLEALEMARNGDETIRLLVTDVVLPGLDGVQVAERLRELSPGLKVIFMSGYTDDTLQRYGIAQGEAPFLEKPFSTEKLSRLVRDLLFRVA